jgi:predicted transcriptional regulator
MKQYRSSLQIVYDVLTITQDANQSGIAVTSLLTKANLSHSRLEKFVKNLTGAGLVNKIEYDGKNAFVITPKGRQYLEQYRKFADVAESFGLEM